MKYETIIRAVQRTPWAILPEKLAEIMEFLEAKANGVEFTREEIEARTGKADKAQDRIFSMRGTSAVIPIQGTIIPKADMFMDVSGGTSLQRVRRQLRESLTDEQVKSIVLDIDSPGGTVDGVPETAREIRQARGSKRIIAQVDTLAASAAYYLASQADEIAITPSGELGSIGVFMAHKEGSKWLEKQGLKVSVIRSSKYKAEVNPWEPLTDHARAELQKSVDEYNDMFVADVAAGRGITTKTVDSKFGQGRMFRATEAVQRGMADRVATMDDTVLDANIRAEFSGVSANVISVRDFESVLRRLGWSREHATMIANHGFARIARDAGSGAATGERESGLTPMIQELLKNAEAILQV